MGREAGAPGILWRAEILLAQALRSLGDLEGARQAAGRARSAAAVVAGRLSDPANRIAFEAMFAEFELPGPEVLAVGAGHDPDVKGASDGKADPTV
jgi:hypothetical protein